MFTKRQQPHYRKTVDQAWTAHATRHNLPLNSKPAKRQWYEKQLMQCLGVTTTKHCNPAEHFDDAMLHFAIIANDEYWINRTTQSEERRYIYQIHRLMLDYQYVAKRPITWDYIRAIHKQAHQLPERIRDTPAPMLRQILQMLDTHIRRICHAEGIPPSELPTRAHPQTKPRPINPENKYVRIGHDLDRDHIPATKKTKPKAQQDLPF